MMQSVFNSNFSSTEDVISLIYNNVNQTTETPLEFHPCDTDERNIEFNCSAEEYLRFYRGPQTLPFIIVIPVSLLLDTIKQIKKIKLNSISVMVGFHIPSILKGTSNKLCFIDIDENLILFHLFVSFLVFTAPTRQKENFNKNLLI